MFANAFKICYTNTVPFSEAVTKIEMRDEMPNITEIRCKQACNKINSNRLPFSWDLNIYRGCQHACVYCYAMYSHDYLNADSHANDIFVKVNIVEQLERQLRSPGWKREEINIGGVTDSYQPLEAKYKLMPDILKLLIRYKTPCSISTKSDLILRDYDLLDELSRITYVNIASTITCIDEKVRKKIEPGAKGADAKFHMLQAFSKTNATTGLHHMPVIPYITDQRETIEEIYARAAEAQVTYVIPGIMYLRGKTKSVFFDFIRRAYPDLLNVLTQFYQRRGNAKGYRNAIYGTINEMIQKYGLSRDYSSPKKEKMAQQVEVYQQISLFDQDSLQENSMNQTYPSFAIPKREDMTPKKQKLLTEQSVSDWNTEPFVEIEMHPGQTSYRTVNIPSVQPIDMIVDEERALFYSMRQIARETRAYSDHAKIFYEQALFMKDFEDDYKSPVPFSSYFPYYQRMGYEQLRTYFTWRTQVRDGKINSISVSYAYIYIYELLNQIAVVTPEEGLNKLLTFWQQFRVFEPALDPYIIQWLKDYHVYYPLPVSFRTFVEEHDLMMHYPMVFAYTSSKEDSFDLFVGISKYDIKNSVFYTEKTCAMIKDCFYFVLEQFRMFFQKNGQCFEDLIFYSLSKESAWTPFARALFYSDLKQENRQVVLSEREVYHCEKNHWRCKRVMLYEQGRQLVGYIMKEMECSLRQILKFKYKLTANPKTCDDKIKGKLEKVGIVFPQFIQSCVSEFYAISTRKIVTVDVENLQEIREQALETQEKLIVPEDGLTSQLEVSETEVAAIEEKQDNTSIQEKIAEVSFDRLDDLDQWGELRLTLTNLELAALRLVLAEQSLKPFAMEKMIMLEVLVDGINQKAMDCIGDAVLAYEESVFIYDDYIENIMEMVNV